MSPRTRTLSLVGGSAEQVAQVAHLLGSRMNAWRIGDAANADLLLVDIDSVYGHMDWLKAQASGRRVAALTSTDAHGAEYQLRKPITAQALSDLLGRIPEAPHAAVAPRTVAQAPAQASPPAPEPAAVVAAPTPSAPPAPIEEPAPIPAAPRTLLDLLDEAAPNSCLRLRSNGLQPLFLDGVARTAHAQDTALKALSDWCLRELADVEIEPLPDSAFGTATGNLDAIPYARLSWLAHLVLGEGRLEADLDPIGRYKLARWPQSEREFPKHFRIATAMMKAPATIEEIAAASGSSAADVANFINAYRSSGHIEIEATPAVEPRRGGLFARARKNVED